MRQRFLWKFLWKYRHCFYALRDQLAALDSSMEFTITHKPYRCNCLRAFPSVVSRDAVKLRQNVERPNFAQVCSNLGANDY